MNENSMHVFIIQLFFDIGETKAKKNKKHDCTEPKESNLTLFNKSGENHNPVYTSKSNLKHPFHDKVEKNPTLKRIYENSKRKAYFESFFLPSKLADSETEESKQTKISEKENLSNVKANPLKDLFKFQIENWLSDYNKSLLKDSISKSPRLKSRKKTIKH